MVFSSILFLFYFLPIVLIIYFISPKKYRNLVLFIMSLIFYTWGEPKYVLIMLFSVVLDYTCGKKISLNKLKNQPARAKHWLLLSVLANLSLLGFFKYSDFFIININNVLQMQLPLLNLVLPIGISFYTFQTMSYTIDVYRGKVDMQKNIISFGAYVTLFPQLIAGPIVRYKTIAHELDNRKESYHMVSDGLKRFIMGLGKKVLLANNIGLLWENISDMNLASLPILTAWLGIIAFAFQIYFDFSGYSDMAIGLGKIFGFNFLENFNYPYMAQSITDFWRRWHISLGTWFKEYVYIPLGGNRGTTFNHLRNILVVWALTGFWHGASWNFLVWGIYFGLILIVEKLFLLNILDRMRPSLRRFYSLFLVIISWAIFAFDDLAQGIEFIKSMFGQSGMLYNSTSIYLLYTNIILLLVLAIASTDFPKKAWHSFIAKIKGRDKLVWNIESIALIIVLILSTAYLVDQSYNPFLYFRF